MKDVENNVTWWSVLSSIFRQNERIVLASTRPKGYYCRYERERRGEGKRIQIKTKALLTLLNEIYKPRSATEKRVISYLACLVDKEFRGHSYRSHVSYIESHQGLLHMYGLKRVPSKLVSFTTLSSTKAPPSQAD